MKSFIWTFEKLNREEKLKVEMDFIPQNPDDKNSIVNLLLGKDVAGVIRTRENGTPDFTTSVETTFNSNLNLYRNNCYHFAWHFYMKSLDWNKEIIN